MTQTRAARAFAQLVRLPRLNKAIPTAPAPTQQDIKISVLGQDITEDYLAASTKKTERS